MNGRANTGLLVAAATAGIMIAVLATATSMRVNTDGRSLACTYVSDPHAELELESAAVERLAVRNEMEVNSRLEFAPEPAFGAEITIVAVDEEGHPVPAAELHILEPDQTDWDFDEHVTAFEIDPVGEVRRKGTLVKCDERGRARIPRPTRPTAVLATANELDALQRLYPGEVSPWTIDMQPHHTLEVRTWDERGQPAGDVQLEVHEADSDSLWRGSTDANGHAQIDWLAFSLRWPDAVVVLTAAIPVDPPIERWLPSNLSSPRIVDLVIPSGSTTALRIVDTRGRVLDMGGDLTVYLPHDRSLAQCETKAMRVPLKHGLATIRGIPGGCRELVVGNAEFERRIAPWSNGTWPPTIDIAMEAGAEVVRFVVTCPDGRPLAQRVLEWRQSDTDATETEFSMTGDGREATDADGVFSCFVQLQRQPENDPEDEYPKVMSVFHVIDGAAQPPLRGVVKVESIRGSTRVEPFQVRLSPVPLAVSGRVLDESGAPVVDAYIEVETEVGAGSSNHDLETFAQVFTDSMGRFAVFAMPVHTPVSVKVDIDGDLAAVVDPADTFAFGTSDVEIRVRAQSTIEGRLLVDPDRRDRQFEIEALQGDETHGDFEIWNEGPEMHWRLRSLPAGVYQLRVLVGEDALFTIDDVRVPTAAVVLDPRCLPIDLRGRVPDRASSPESAMRALHLFDARGNPVDHGMWRFQVDGQWHSWWPWQGGELQVFDSFDQITVWCPGFLLREGPVPEREATWTLEPARHVELKLEVPADVRSSSLHFTAKAELGYQESNLLNWFFQHYAPRPSFDSSGNAVVELPVAGRWNFSVVASWEVDGEREGRELETFEIKLGLEQEFEPFKLKPNAEEWLKLLREANAPIAPQRN